MRAATRRSALANSSGKARVTQQVCAPLHTHMSPSPRWCVLTRGPPPLPHAAWPQVTCNGGSTPLHVAALRNDPLMVGYLLEMFVKVGTWPLSSAFLTILHAS